jgi:hypothetical protein
MLVRVGMVTKNLIVMSAVFVGFGVVVAPIQGAQADPSWRTGGDVRACGAPRSFDPINPRGPGQGEKVLVIGDSVTRDSRAMLTKSLKSSGWNPVIRCFGGKRIDWGMSQLRDQRDWEGIPKTVVIALGTNDMRWIDRSTTKARINKILNQIGPTRNVLWVNLYGSNGDRFSKSKQMWFNTVIKKVASNRPNMHVLPWATHAQAAKIPMSGPLHYAHKGLVLRTQLTVGYLNTTFGENPPNR